MARAFIRIQTDQTGVYYPLNRPVIITTPVNAVAELDVDIDGNNTVTIVDMTLGDFSLLPPVTNLTGDELLAIFQGNSLFNVTLNNLSAFFATILNGIPAGGTTGQVLAKSSNTNYAVTWKSELYLIKTYFNGIPGSNQIIVADYVVNTVSWLADFAGSRFYCVTPPNSDYIITVKKNGTAIGTITFLASSHTATFATSGNAAQNAVDGDRIELFAPVTPDAISQIYGTLAGTRQ